MKNKPSVVSAFGGLGLAILFMVMLALGSMLLSVSAQNDLRVRFVARVHAADTVVADLHALDTAFNTYRRSWDSALRMDYLETGARLARDVDAYGLLCSDAQDTQNYLRRLRSFNEYQQQMLAAAGEEPVRLYALSAYISGAIEQHQQQAREMAQADLGHSSDEFERASRDVRTRILVILGALALFSLVMFMAMVRTYFSTARALQTVDRHFDELSRGNWEIPDLTVNNWREFGALSGMINRMKHEIKDYLAQIEAKAQVEKQLQEEKLVNEQQHSMLIAAQMSALRAQVNPHFLFNALNMIGVTAMVDTSESVMEMVEAVGSILRYSLYSNGIMTLLDDEVEIVQRYLFLQKKRFGDALTVEVRNELEGEDYTIPSMTIQPVVENCFKHGFGNKKQLHIQLFISMDESDIRICITDNGVGFDPAKRPGEGGIGLDNIRRRLALQYGAERARMEIESEPGRFSTVTLYIPTDKEPPQ